MKLKFKNRFTKYLNKPKDIAIIEIKESDEIYEDIDIFSLHHPNGNDASCASGIIKGRNDYEFEHDVSTDNGSSGCPIILLNNINLIQVIGIHKKEDASKKINIGTFLGEILNENSLINNNYIIAELNIENKDVNKDIRIINSYIECIRKFQIIQNSLEMVNIKNMKKKLRIVKLE